MRPFLPLQTLPEHELCFLQEKHDCRKASVELLKALVLKSETRTAALAIAAQDQQLCQRNAMARRLWLDRLEEDLLVDQVGTGRDQTMDESLTSTAGLLRQLD